MSALLPPAAADALRVLAEQRATLSRYTAVLAAIEDLAGAADPSPIAGCLDQADLLLAQLRREHAEFARLRIAAERSDWRTASAEAWRDEVRVLAADAASAMVRACRLEARLAARRLVLGNQLVELGRTRAAADYPAGPRAAATPLLVDATG